MRNKTLTIVAALTMIALVLAVTLGLAAGRRDRERREAAAAEAARQAQIAARLRLEQAARKEIIAAVEGTAARGLSLIGQDAGKVIVAFERLSVSQPTPTQATVMADVQLTWRLEDGNHGPVHDQVFLDMVLFNDGWRTVPNADSDEASCQGVRAVNDLAVAMAYGVGSKCLAESVDTLRKLQAANGEDKARP